MSTWREVQERLYKAWVDGWDGTTPFCLGNEKFDPPNGQWVRFSVRAGIGQQGSMGPQGARRFDRSGRVFIQLFEPPGHGVGSLSDLAEQARDLFEGKRFAPHDIRFNEADIGNEGDVDPGRWWGVTVEARFDYEEIK